MKFQSEMNFVYKDRITVGYGEVPGKPCAASLSKKYFKKAAFLGLQSSWTNNTIPYFLSLENPVLNFLYCLRIGELLLSYEIKNV